MVEQDFEEFDIISPPDTSNGDNEPKKSESWRKWTAHVFFRIVKKQDDILNRLEEGDEDLSEHKRNIRENTKALESITKVQENCPIKDIKSWWHVSISAAIGMSVIVGIFYTIIRLLGA